ncbi:MAG: UbiX family flavin prenyltransferase [Myxococcota bacterium]
MSATYRIVVCITGASGSIYARRLLHYLNAIGSGQIDVGQPDLQLRVDVVASQNAPDVWAQELGEPMPEDLGTGVRRWDRMNFSAPFASGSNAPNAVIAMPCSMSTLARVANGGGSDLIARACEVALKERRTLILTVRETPLSLVHLRNMVRATEAGAIVLPAVPSFYIETRTLEQAVDTVVVRALDRAGLRIGGLSRWGDDA